MSTVVSQALPHSDIWTLLSHSNLNPVSEMCGKMLKYLHKKPPVEFSEGKNQTFDRG